MLRPALANFWRQELSHITYKPELVFMRNAGPFKLVYNRNRELRRSHIDGKCPFCRALREFDQKNFPFFRNFNVIANEWPLIEEHYVFSSIWHEETLSVDDTYEICLYSIMLDDYFFIYNMKGAAATIPEHSHFQAFKMNTPLFDRMQNTNAGDGSVVDGICITPVQDATFGYYICLAGDLRVISRVLFMMARLVQIPFNLVIRHGKIYVFPRRVEQPKDCPKKLGGLELTGVVACFSSEYDYTSVDAHLIHGWIEEATLQDLLDQKKFESMITAAVKTAFAFGNS